MRIPATAGSRRVNGCLPVRCPGNFPYGAAFFPKRPWFAPRMVVSRKIKQTQPAKEKFVTTSKKKGSAIWREKWRAILCVRARRCNRGNLVAIVGFHEIQRRGIIRGFTIRHREESTVRRPGHGAEEVPIRNLAFRAAGGRDRVNRAALALCANKRDTSTIGRPCGNGIRPAA